MTPYIPKQLRQARDRIEAKLDRELIQQLELYCQYLESDREYVIGKALEIAFRKDKGFREWLTTQGEHAANLPADQAMPQAKRRGRPRMKNIGASPATSAGSSPTPETQRESPR